MQAASSKDDGTVWSRSGWMTKKGKKRFFVLCGGELQWFAKELDSTTSQTQVSFMRRRWVGPRFVHTCLLLACC
jgi:hypothetical protein